MDTFNFLFHTGSPIITNKAIERHPNGKPKLKPKKGSISYIVKGFRTSPNLEIEGMEAVFFQGIYLGPNDKILIPFNTVDAVKGLEIDIIFYLRFPDEKENDSWKSVQIRDYKTIGGFIKLIDLFKYASKQGNQASHPEPTDTEENIDWVVNVSMWKGRENTITYQVKRINKNKFEVRNWDNNQTLLNFKAPRTQGIFKKSKFYTPPE